MVFTSEDRKKIKDTAWEAVSGKKLKFWFNFLAAGIVAGMISSVIKSVLGQFDFFAQNSIGVFIACIISLFLSAPIHLVSPVFSLALWRKEDFSWRDVFDVLKAIFFIETDSSYHQLFRTWLSVTIRVCLWSMLFVLPGIYFGIRYSMAMYIKIDNPSLDSSECIERSKQLTNGHVTDFLLFQFSFILWVIGAFVTFGISNLWFIPYICCANAGLYEWLRGNENR